MAEAIRSQAYALKDKVLSADIADAQIELKHLSPGIFQELSLIQTHKHQGGASGARVRFDDLVVQHILTGTGYVLAGDSTNLGGGGTIGNGDVGAKDDVRAGDDIVAGGDIYYTKSHASGCYSFHDEGVVLRNGELVDDTEAIKRFKKHPTEMTTYGQPKIDPQSMPEFITTTLEGDTENKIYYTSEAMVSLLIGAVRELTGRIEKLEGVKNGS